METEEGPKVSAPVQEEQTDTVPVIRLQVSQTVRIMDVVAVSDQAEAWEGAVSTDSAHRIRHIADTITNSGGQILIITQMI